MSTVRNKEGDTATDREELTDSVADHSVTCSCVPVFPRIGKPKGNTCLGNYHLANGAR